MRMAGKVLATATFGWGSKADANGYLTMTAPLGTPQSWTFLTFLPLAPPHTESLPRRPTITQSVFGTPDIFSDVIRCRDTYFRPLGLFQNTSIHQIRIPRDIEQRRGILSQERLDTALRNALGVITAGWTALGGFTLLLHRAAHVFQIRRVPGIDDIIGDQNGHVRHDKAQLLAQLQVRRVRGLIMVQEEDLDLFDFAAGIQLVQTQIAPPDQDAHEVAQPGQIEQHVRDGRVLRVHFQAVVSSTTCATRGIAEQDGRVADVAAQLDHGLGLALCDQLRDDLAFRSPDVHKIVPGGELVDQIEHFLRVALDFIPVGLVVDEVQELEFTVILALLLLA